MPLCRSLPIFGKIFPLVDSVSVNLKIILKDSDFFGIKSHSASEYYIEDDLSRDIGNKFRDGG